jgi:hypothetical protein
LDNADRFGYKPRRIGKGFPQLIARLNRLITSRLSVIRRAPFPLLAAWFKYNGVGRVAKKQYIRLEKPDGWMVY